MVTYFETYADRYDGVTGASIREATKDPKRDTDAIASLAKELGKDAKNIDREIEGDIQEGTRYNPKEAQGTALEIVKAGRYAVGLMIAYSESVDQFDKGVNDLNERLLINAHEAYVSANRKAKKTDTEVPEYAETFAAERAKLEPAYRRLDSALEDAAELTANMFRAGVTDAYVRTLVLSGHIPFTEAVGLWPKLGLDPDERRRSLKNEIARLDARGQADWARNNSEWLGKNPHYAREAVKTISAEAQTILAQETAADIKEPKNIDAETVRIMDLLKNQAAFAFGLYLNVTPREVANAVKYQSGQAYPMHDFSERAKEAKEFYKKFLTAAGVTFATYTKGSDQYAPPANLADIWKAAITTDDHRDRQGAALTLLLRAGGQQAEFETKFMSDLAGGIYEWERDQDGTVWGPRSNVAIPVFNPFSDPQESWASRATDGLANLLAAMAKSPSAAENFFAGRYAGAEDSMEQKIDYFIGGKDGRTWDGGDGSDDGDGLGLALEAATIGRDSRTEEGTDLAKKVFNNIAKYGGVADGPDGSKWHVGPNMTDSLGAIAAGYINDVYDELIDKTDPEDGPRQLNLDAGVLEKVLGEIGRTKDKTGLETLTAAMLLQAKWENLDTLNRVDGNRDLNNHDVDRLKNVQRENGNAVAALLLHGLSLAGNEEKTEVERAKILGKAVDAAAGFIPGLGNFAADGIKGIVITGIKDSITAAPNADSTAAGYLDKVTKNIEDRMRNDAIDSLIAKGFAGEPYNGDDWAEKNRLPAAILTDDKPPRIDPRLNMGDPSDVDTSALTAKEKADWDKTLKTWPEVTRDKDELWDDLNTNVDKQNVRANFIDVALPES